MSEMKRDGKSIRYTRLFGVTLLVLLTALPSLMMVGCGRPTDPAGPNHAPNPAQIGPYDVGVTTLRLTDETRTVMFGTEGNQKEIKRPMVIEIWYPAIKPENGKTDSIDIYKDAPPEVVAEAKRKNFPEFSPLEQDAYRDAKPMTTDGPYPIIIFSHGSGGLRFQNYPQCTHMASHGYVVVSVDHEENTAYNLIMGANARDNNVLVKSGVTDRPADLKFVLNELKKRNEDANDMFYKMVQPDNVGVTGHSLGGTTALAAPRFVKDVKFKALIPQVAAINGSYITGGIVLTEIAGITEKHLGDIPIMIMASRGDSFLTYEKESKLYYEKTLLSEPYFKADRFMLTLDRGGHITYSITCAFDAASFFGPLGYESEQEMLDDGCSKEKNITTRTAFGYINFYSTAMFNIYLRGSTGTRPYLETRSDDETTFVADRVNK